MSGATFARQTLETSWTEEQCDAYIRVNNLRLLKEKIIQMYPRETPIMWKMITCATDIRTKFFTTYPGLLSRIEREKVFATENGYVRTWHGALRRTPELFLMDHEIVDNKIRITGDDRSLYGSLISNLHNITANTAIQNLEAVIVMSAIIELHNWLKENKMKSYVFGSVHDSIDFVIAKDELQVVSTKIQAVCTRMWPEFYGMPQGIDIQVADTTLGECYKGGKKLTAVLRL